MIHLYNSAEIKRISPCDAHYFFGYYDLQPYNKSQTRHLVHKTMFRNRLQDKNDIAEVGFIDMNNGKYEMFDTTPAWNFQQGAMLQWNPLSPENQVVYNSIDDGEYCAVVMDIESGKKRLLECPVANVSRDGRWAIGINMSRLYDFRPGYGYAAVPDKFYHKNHCNNDGVFLIDMQTGKSKLVLSMEEIWEFSGSFFDKDEKMIINHITFNPSADRFLALVRNFPVPGKKHSTAVITANRDGSDMYLLSDYGIQSHYWWLNDDEVIFFNDGKELDCTLGLVNNYILKDKSHQGQLLADGFFVRDNHMSFSPDNSLMITDSYPDENGHQVIQLYSPSANICVDLGYFYSMPNVCTDVRCDLHPRWNRSGDGITFDSTHEGFRGVYKMDLSPEKADGFLRQTTAKNNIKPHLL